MTDQVEAELKSLGTQALQDLMNNLTQAKGFVLEQAPDFCNQMVAWAIASGVAAVILAALALIAVGSLLVYFWRKEIVEGLCMVSVVGGMLCLFLFINAVIDGTRALKAYVAPKVFLVEEIARMLK